jgi:diguanylate cyclase (GGDEF)-like protein
MNLRILLVESQPEEVVILQDVLREIEDEGWLREWAHLELLHASTCAEAERVLSGPPSLPNVLLLNPDLADGQGAGTFRRLQASAPDVPTILLVGASDQSLAVTLVREGAQDFLIQKQVDCGPLAHALRNAVARHRLLAAARAAALSDFLTGLPNRTSFLAFADRDRKLAERLDRRWMVLIAEPRNLGGIADAYHQQRRDLELVEAADYLRSIASPGDTLARIGSHRFAITIFDSEPETLEEAWMRIRTGAYRHRLDVGASIFDRHRALLSLDAMLEQAEQDLAPTPKPADRNAPRVAGAA